MKPSPLSSTPTSASRDAGFALVATLAVMIVLAIAAAIVLSRSSAVPPPTGLSTNVSTTTTPQSVASAAKEATVAGCQANFALVDTALATYRAEHGTYPPAGTSWATSSANGAALLNSWPSGAAAYTLRWNGATLDVVPVRGVPSRGTFGTSTPPTGCFAP